MSTNKITISDLVKSISDKITVADVYAADAISEVSSAILRERLSMGMTQTEFGELLGVRQGMVSKWENGDYNFTLKAIAEICAKLDLVLSISLENYVEHTSSWSSDTKSQKQSLFSDMSENELLEFAA